MTQTLALVLLMLVAACGRPADRADTIAGRADTGGMAGMTGMGSMSGGMMGSAMMDSMAAHMRSMDTSASGIQAMMPMHRPMAANMIAQMNSEMRSMNMAADASWTALMDSVRQDLVRIPEMSAQQLKTFWPAHQGRLMRLMQRHGDMMKGMQQ